MSVEDGKVRVDTSGANQDLSSVDWRKLMKGVVAMTLVGTGFAGNRSAIAGTETHDMGVLAAASAIRDGSITSEAYTTKLLQRARDNSDLNAFITIDDTVVLQAARAADKGQGGWQNRASVGCTVVCKGQLHDAGSSDDFRDRHFEQIQA